MQQNFNDGLIRFLQASPTPHHAVRSLERRLEEAGFSRLDEHCPWQLERERGYYVTRNGSSIIAFSTGRGQPGETGLAMAGAHTDSPCLKVKPQPEIRRHGYLQLGVEVYGGALLNPWFDRDLSLAGRVHYRDADGRLRDGLVDFRRPLAVIPNLAIHLDREANQNRSVNAQLHLPPILKLQGKAGQGAAEQEGEALASAGELHQLLLARLHEEGMEDAREVLDFELSFYDVQPPALVGLEEEFLAGARLDNLLSCYLGVEGLLAAGHDRPALMVCNDHEEVGSVSAAGAAGPFLTSVLERLAEQLAGDDDRDRPGETYRRMLGRSMMISLDNAHGIHPNYADRHDPQHGPRLNAGPVIKINANQRYATSSETSAFFRQLCGEAEVPVQAFVVRSDMGCGSTIGPIVAGQLGVRTLDVGVPTFAMHSIRELAGSRDGAELARVLTRYFGTDQLGAAA